MPRVYLGLGSNLDCPERQIVHAVSRLMQLPRTHWLGVSSLYRSLPHGPQDQPDFINAVACIDTDLTPLELLDHCQKIERAQKRVKKRHWGERTIDVDILLYGDQKIDLPRLTVPHPHMSEREFVMQPLLEILGVNVGADLSRPQQTI